MRLRGWRVNADVVFIMAGIGVIAVAILRLVDPIGYLPSDLRSQPWFYPVSSSILAAFGLFFVIVGVVRLIRGSRNRTGDE